MLAPNNFLYRKHISASLPYEQISNPEVDDAMNVINALKANAGNINNGGCGYFAIMLQELIGGNIYHLNYMFKKGLNYEFTLGHEFVIKGDYCYDSKGVCRRVTLFREKKLKKAYNSTQVQHIPQRDHYVLFNDNRERILDAYGSGRFYGNFNENQLKQLQANFENITNNSALLNVQTGIQQEVY